MTSYICPRPNCTNERVVLTVDGKRKRAPVCRKHLPNRYRHLLDPRRECESLNMVGKPCRSAPLKPGREVFGVTVSGRWCMAHDEDLMELPASEKTFGTSGSMGGRPRTPKKTEIVLKMIEDAAAELIAEQLHIARSAQKPVVVGNGAHAEMEMAPDLQARLKAIDGLLDRLMGKARITTEIIGADGKTAEAKRVPTSPDRARKVAEILASSQAVTVQKGHATGRRRSSPPEPAQKPEEASS